MSEWATLLSAGLEHQRQGRLDLAEAAYQRVLQQFPDQPDAVHLLGTIALTRGDAPEARSWIEKAVAARPDHPVFRANLAEACRLAMDWENAIAHAREALALRPNYATAWRTLAKTFFSQGRTSDSLAAWEFAHQCEPGSVPTLLEWGHALGADGRHDEMIERFVAARSLDPNDSLAALTLGATLMESGRFEEALPSLEWAAQVGSANPECWHQLGFAYRRLDRLDDAIGAWERALALMPAAANIHTNLGNALRERGDLSRAVIHFRRAVEQAGDRSMVRVNLALALIDAGENDKAQTQIREALGSNEDDSEAWKARAILLAGAGQVEESLESFRRALQRAPNDGSIHDLLGTQLKNRGDIPQALEHYQQAARLSPLRAGVESNYLLCLNYDASHSQRQVVEAHRDWGRRQVRGLRTRLREVERELDPDRPLRIGYVSPDFRRHAVWHFVEPILSHHRRDQFIPYLYAQVTRPDEVTREIRGRDIPWIDTVGLSDDQMADRIEADQIDLLIDLAGHTKGSRLGVFARKPAPIQLGYLGYPNMTGLSTIDYRISDDVLDPWEEAPLRSEMGPESPLRIEGGFCTFSPLRELPDLDQDIPHRDHIVFGSHHNPAKLSPLLLETWRDLLEAMPRARLVVARAALSSDERAYLGRRLDAAGLDSSRTSLLDSSTVAGGWLGLYRDIDVSLDAFPYSGHTTTMESLTMGTPVLTLWGDRPAQRVSASLLTSMGMAEWIAHSREEYIHKARQLTLDRSRLLILGRELRSRMTQCNLGNPVLFIERYERALRLAWKRLVSANK